MRTILEALYFISGFTAHFITPASALFLSMIPKRNLISTEIHQKFSAAGEDLCCGILEQRLQLSQLHTRQPENTRGKL